MAGSLFTRSPTWKPLLGAQLNRSHPLAQGLVTAQIANESGGKILNDTAGIYPGALTSSTPPSWGPGRFGPALLYTAAGASYVPIANSAPLQLSRGTTSAWIKTANAGAGFVGVYLKQLAYGMLLNSNVFIIYDWNAGAVRSTGINVADNRWHHLAVTFDSGVTNGTTLYLDGVAVLTTTMTVNSQVNPLEIGRGFSGGQYFDGQIDNTMVYNRLLTGAEVQQLYTQPFAMFGRSSPIGIASRMSSPATIGVIPARRPAVWRPPLGTKINAGHPLSQGVAAYYALNENGGSIINNQVGPPATLANSGVSFSVSQNWDGVTAPSVSITGWTIGSGWTTTTTQRVSLPNSITITPSAYSFLTYNTIDTASGNVRAVAKFYIDNNPSFGAPNFGVAVRGSATPLNSTSTTFYAAEVFCDNSFSGAWDIVLYKVVSGTWTSLASITGILSSSVANAWFEVGLSASGTSLSVTLIRSSDGNYLNSSGVFTASVANCLSVTDSSITGSGYLGAYANPNGINANIVYTDDFQVNSTAVLGPKWGVGLRGSVPVFDGATDYIDCGNPAPTIAPRYTVACWAKITAAPAIGVLLAYRSTSAGNPIIFQLDYAATTRVPRLVVRDDAGTLTSLSSSVALPLGSWAHVAVTKNGTALAIYVNGVPTGTATYTGTDTITVNSLNIGALTQGAPSRSSFATGQIDLPEIWGRALSASEIRQIYTQPFAQFPGPKQWIPVDTSTSSASIVLGTPFSSTTVYNPTISAGAVNILLGTPFASTVVYNPTVSQASTGTSNNLLLMGIS